MYPNHEDQIRRLNKIEGQVKGIRKMIEDQRYCVDIVSQVKAAMAALRQVELGVLESHIQHCVQAAMNTNDTSEVEEKIKEIMKLVGKMP
ncbi:MAG: metal-sensitive transcriptional regulator [SAR324 cluster bacterium]|nr:metal-sensitive transcriptional regulator [SAR324 cluster bacterium]